MRVAVVNAGSATIKLALFDVDGSRVRERQRVERAWRPTAEADRAIDGLLAALEESPDAFGHRVVQGGSLVAPTLVTKALLGRLEALLPLAPLHNGVALTAMRAVRRMHPGRPSVAVFDTAFHAGRPDAAQRYAVPATFESAFEIRRYGFHGIAHRSLLESLAATLAIPPERVTAITLQLGGGCSACAIRDGRSIETTMGYSPLSGLPMPTRSGDLDPAIVLRLMRAGRTADDIERVLTEGSGLFAISGLRDMRELVAAALAGRADAALALDVFCHHLVLTIGAYATLLEGRGAIVFGGGIGANSVEVRRRIGKGLGAWNVKLYPTRNVPGATGLVATTDSRPVFAFRTDEEAVIAREVVGAL
jgi:acetate kinase